RAHAHAVLEHVDLDGAGGIQGDLPAEERAGSRGVDDGLLIADLQVWAALGADDGGYATGCAASAASGQRAERDAIPVGVRVRAVIDDAEDAAVLPKFALRKQRLFSAGRFRLVTEPESKWL